MALNSLFCADVPLSNYSLTHCRQSEMLPPLHSPSWTAHTQHVEWHVVHCRAVRRCIYQAGARSIMQHHPSLPAGLMHENRPICFCAFYLYC